MAIAVKDAAASATKFAQRAAAAGADYVAGVRGAGARWAAGTAAGAENWALSVQAAVTRGAFARGVAEAGPGKYTERASTIGAQRFPQGAQAAGPEWQRKTQPYLDVIRQLDLPPRRPAGDPGNNARAQMVGQALRARKVGG